MNKNKSISPITGKEYLIPDACDEKNIKQFLSDNSQRNSCDSGIRIRWYGDVFSSSKQQ